MTRHVSTLAAQIAPELCTNIVPQKKRAQGKPGAQCTRSLACESKEAHELITTGSPEQSDFPCAMVLTAYNALSPVTGLFCHRRLQVISRKLDSSVGAPGPHALAVRDGAARLATPPASIASRLAFVTMANAPLVEAGQREGSH